MNLDVEQEERYLPPTLKQLIGQRNRVYGEDDTFFVRIFPYEDRIAMLNNMEACKFATGFVPDLHNKLLNSQILKIVDGKLTEKIVANVCIEGESDEQVESLNNGILDFEDTIEAAISFMLQRGEVIIAATKITDDGDSKVVLDVYPLARYNVKTNAFGRINEVFLFQKLFDGETAYSKYVLMEHRFKQGTNYYSEYNVVEYSFQNKDSFTENMKSYKLEVKDLSDALKEKLDGLEINKKIQIERIGIYKLKNTAVNYLCPFSKIGESQYIKTLDNVVSLDTSFTYREVDKNIGRGRMMVPSLKASVTTKSISISKNGEIIRDDYGSKTILDDTFIQPYESVGAIEKNTPQAVQFNLRVQEWIEDKKDRVATICTACGLSVFDYDPTLFGGVRTATEIDELGDITASTVKTKRNRVTKQLNEMLSDIAAMLNIDVKAFIKWDKSSTVNAAKNNELVIAKKNAGLISKREALKELYPNWDDVELDAELERIDSETDSQDANVMFNSL